MTNSMGPGFIPLQVRDLEASRHFYKEEIGLPAAPEVRPNAVTFATKSLGFAIRKAQIGPDAKASPGNGINLWFYSEDSAALLKLLKNEAR